MRVFIAVDINDSMIISFITKIQKELSATRSSDLRPVAPENLHITLKFLGDIDDKMVDAVVESIGGVEFTKFKIKLRGLGYFPGGGRVNVIWAGVKEGSDQLRGLHSLVEDNLSHLGFRRDAFSPHLTIARVKSVRDKRSLLAAISGHSDTEIGEQWVDSLTVKKSTLLPSGPEYTNLLVRKF
ncbi:MAG: RNA 2',3'-cyclic phosphodiesterase [Nitrososphaerota archaeon]